MDGWSLLVWWKVELFTGQLFDLFLVYSCQLLVSFASGFSGGRFCPTALDLLAMKQIVEVHSPFSRVCNSRWASLT